MSSDKIQSFQKEVWDYYRTHGRNLPWRPPLLKLRKDGSLNPYAILVSEMMLQQTQVARVIPKYLSFLEQFPDANTLAQANLGAVLKAWSGLGYNRRAKYLHDAAKQLLSKKQPWSLEDLMSCKGIGFNTAAAVVTYAYNLPVAFIETNIRTVYIYCFFAKRANVTDKELYPLVKHTLDHTRPREFFWALMDYGASLKTTVGNISRQSKHYTKQSRFEGSIRQIRGHVLRLLGQDSLNAIELANNIPDKRLSTVLKQLGREQLIKKQGDSYRLY